MDREDPPTIWQAFWDGYTLTGLFGRPACSHPVYVWTARVFALINTSIVIGGNAYLILNGHPVAAGGMVLWGLAASLTARR